MQTKIILIKIQMLKNKGTTTVTAKIKNITKNLLAHPREKPE